MIPYSFPLFQAQTEEKNYYEYLHMEIQEMMKYIVREGSTTKYIAIAGMDITVFRLRNTGTVFPGYEDLYNSRNKFIFTFDRPNNMCTLQAVFIAIWGCSKTFVVGVFQTKFFFFSPQKYLKCVLFLT
jgi:hypothetical protein